MAIGRAAPAGPRQTAAPIQAGPDGRLTAVASPRCRARQTGCRLAAVSRTNDLRSSKVRDRPGGSIRADSHSSNVPMALVVKAVTISDRGNTTAHGQAP